MRIDGRTRRKRRPIWLPAALCLLAHSPALADVIAYHGRITVDGEAYNGQGRFKFALLAPDGNVLWRNSEPDATGSPGEALSLEVKDGSYRVELGDKQAGMPALPSSVVSLYPNVSLRVWFEGAGAGSQQIAPDERLGKKAAVVTMKAPPQRRSTATTTNTATQRPPGFPDSTPVQDLSQALQQPSAVARPPAEAAAGFVFNLNSRRRYMIGKRDAPVVMVEFADFECGHCAMFHDITYKKIKEEFIDTGKLLYVVGNFPLKQHKNAWKGVEASYCAGDQGAFWEMRDLLFANSSSLSTEKMVGFAQQLGLNQAAFFSCLEGGQYNAQTNADKEEGRAFGVRQTPSFALGVVSANGDFKGSLIAGTRYWSEFKRRITAIIDSK